MIPHSTTPIPSLSFPNHNTNMGLRSFLARRKKSKSLSNDRVIENSLRSISLSKSSNTHVEELKHVFNKFDVNGDGKISHSELSSIMVSLGQPASEEELEGMIKEVDSDGDGFIDLDEFIELNTTGADLDDLKNAFLIFDLDGNGSISPEELHKVLKSLGDEKCSIEECKKMIRGVDVDGDGLINFDEFKVMMTGPMTTTIG